MSRLFEGATPQGVIHASVAFAPDGSKASCTFDNLVLELVGKENLIGTAAYSFEIHTGVIEDRPDLEIEIAYFIRKTPLSTARLIFMGCDALASEDFPFGSSTDENRRLTVKCPGRRESAGTSFKFTLAIMAHRMNRDQEVLLAVDTLDAVPISDGDSDSGK